MLFPDRRLLVGIAVWIGAASAAVVVPSWAPLASLAALVGLGVVAVDALWLWRQPAVEIARTAPARLAVGRAGELELVLRNPGARASEVEVEDELPEDLAASPVRWRRVELPGRGERRLRTAVSPRRRGDRPLGRAAALQASPLRLLRRRVTGEASHIGVYPDASRFLRPEALDPRAVLAQLGVKPARRRGEGLEFESLRDYVPGDDPRRIEWRAVARRGRLVVRQLQHEHNHRVHLALDASRLMGARHAGRTKLDHAIDAVLALAYASLGTGDHTSLSVFDRTLRAALEPRRSRAELGAFVDAVRAVEASLVEPDYRAWVREVLVRHRKRSLVVVFTDFVESDAEALVAPLALLARQHRVLLVALRDHGFDELEQGVSGPEPLRIQRRIVLDDLLREREEALARLRRHGLHTLDLVPETATAHVLNRYLALRYGEPA